MRASIVPCLLVIALTGSVAAARTPASTPRHASVPPYSFLPRAGGSARGIVSQLEKSPALRQRYANHFHTTPDNVVKYVRERLVDAAIPATRSYIVWMAKPDGRKYAHVKTLRKGSRVLALRDGTPILQTRCGNPFVSHITFVPAKYLKKKVKPASESRRRYVATVTPYELEQGFIVEAPFEMGLQTPFADVPLSALRQQRGIIPLWWRTGGDDGVIPEPSSLALLAVVLLPLAAVGRWHNVHRHSGR